MEERGWNQEFRTMGDQVLIQKKILRDLGLENSLGGNQHLRKNLLQIIQVEVLLESGGWGINPGEKSDHFESLDGEVLSEDLTRFWKMCTDNRNSGILCLAKHKPVDFCDVYSLAKEKEEKNNKRDFKKMAKELPKMVFKISDNYPLKNFLSNQIPGVIKSNNYEKILELFELVTEGINFEVSDASSDSEGLENEEED